LINHSSL